MPEQYIAIHEINLWHDNYRHGDVGAIATSLKRFGLNRSIALWQNKTVIAGNKSI